MFKNGKIADSEGPPDERFIEWIHLFPRLDHRNWVFVGTFPEKTISDLREEIDGGYVLGSRTRCPVSGIKRIDLVTGQKLPLKDAEISVLAIWNLPDASLLKELARVWRPGGALFCRVEKLEDRENIREGLHLDSFDEYAILIDYENPRWFVPVKNPQVARGALAIFQPSLWKGKLLKKTASILSLVGNTGLWTPNRFLIGFQSGPQGNGDVDLRRFIGRTIGCEEVHLAVFTGTVGCHRKPTIQVMDKMGGILAFGKITKNPEILPLLENEHRVLGQLSGLKLISCQVPRILFYGKFNDSTLLLQSTEKRISSSGSLRLGGRHFRFLEEIHQKTRKRKRFDRDEQIRLPRVLFQPHIEGLRDLWVALWREGLKKIEKGLSGKEIVFSLAHGDFTPWNTFNIDGIIFIFDWEMAIQEAPPFYDLFHYLIQTDVLVRHLSSSRIIRKIKNTLHDENLKRLMVANGILDEDFYLYFIWYLLIASNRYLNEISIAGNITEENRGLLDIWSRLLKEINTSV